MKTQCPIPTLAGLWREAGGLDGLVRLGIPAVTPGMVVVALLGEPWQTNPNLRWQVWPDDLQRYAVTTGGGAQ